MSAGIQNDPTLPERVALQQAWSTLVEVRDRLQSPPVHTDSVIVRESWFDAMRGDLACLRAVLTTSRRAGGLRRLSDDLLAAIGPKRIVLAHEQILDGMEIKHLSEKIDKAMRSVDGRLQELRRSFLQKDSPLIDQRIGNSNLTIGGLALTLYLGGLAIVANLLQTPVSCFLLTFGSAIVSIVFAIDLFMVIWTRPYWLYLPSENSISSRILNWKHLWVLLLIPFSLAVFALYILFINLYGFVAVLVNEQVLRAFLSVLSAASLVGLIVAYAGWRKREYLVCPHCDFRPQNKGALDVHFEREHGMQLKKAISELRVLLSKKQEKKAVGLTKSIGFFLVAMSWFVSYEVLFYEKFGNLYDMFLLILFDVILLWWGRHLLTRGVRPRIDPNHRMSKKAWSQGTREGFKLIVYPIILKGLVVVFLELPFVLILGESLTIIAAIVLFQNSGLYLGIIVLYLRQQSRSVLVDSRRWEEIWSAKKSITWVLASYITYLGMGALSLLGGHSLIEILRFSFMSADLIGIAWAYDYGNEVWKQILDAGDSRKKRRRSKK